MKKFLLSFAAAALILSTYACRETPDDKKVEVEINDTEYEIRESADNAGDRIEDALDNAGDAIEDAGEKIKEEAHDATH